MGFYNSDEKRYGVYMISYRMWRGNINYNQKPRFASNDKDKVIAYADEELVKCCDGTAYAIVDYRYDTTLFVKVKENGKYRTI